MLFEVDEKSQILEPVSETWKVSELELEKYIISSQELGVPTLNYSIFNEELLIINNQVCTKTKKRADILALDKMGNAVIIELKRDHESLGVDTQALLRCASAGEQHHKSNKDGSDKGKKNMGYYHDMASKE